MEIIHTISQMQARADEWRAAGLKIACVPTMGYLHEGHLELMRAGRTRADKLVVSIFVNPTQFGPGEDLDRYPRDFEGDERKCRDVGVDCIFYPSAEEMYPPGYQTYVMVEKVSQGLCAKDRPTHFRGVATVVTKLFNIMKPHLAIFGEKDFQQLRVIERMVKDLNMDIEIIGWPTVREPDGLAMSSRNTYLSAEERRRALRLYQALCHAQDIVARGERDVSRVVEEARRVIEQGGGIEILYVEIRDEHTLEEIETIQGPARLALAAKVGKTRLIDNCALLPG